MSEADRQALGAFLRTHRERLRMVDVGLPPRRGDRRRTPGLRREEVALLCGLSPTWYSWIEQGRDIAASASTLARLADGLKLNRVERAYLFKLARRQDPTPDVTSSREAAPATLQQVLCAIRAPAYALDRLWGACGWNEAAADLFDAWLGGPEPCLLRYVFLDPGARTFIVDWPERARRLVAEFRADTSRLSEDPDLGALVSHLRHDSPAFDQLWGAHDILGREGGLRLFEHSRDGRIGFEQVTLQLAGHEQFKVVVLLPSASTL